MDSAQQPVMTSSPDVTYTAYRAGQKRLKIVRVLKWSWEVVQDCGDGYLYVRPKHRLGVRGVHTMDRRKYPDGYVLERDWKDKNRESVNLYYREEKWQNDTSVIHVKSSSTNLTSLTDAVRNAGL